jgi:hypothetical protein
MPRTSARGGGAGVEDGEDAGGGDEVACAGWADAEGEEGGG